MLNIDIDKLEMAKIEINKVGIISERAMRKLEMIMNTLDRLEKETENGLNDI